MEKLFKYATAPLVLVGLMGGIIMNSCCEENSAPDTKHLKSFHQTLFEKKVNPIKGDNLSLYVDYSTCIKEGQHSAFFQSLVPSFVDATKSYYSIKGPEIIKENFSDIDGVYKELKNIIEVNYADLKNAAKQIAVGDSEGVLLTDGEYFQNDIAKGNINNPYLAEPFKIWLKKGHDIYILAEPYIEKHNGNNYDKKRFYFLFTDNRLNNNIYDRICQTVKLEDFPNVEIFHLSADHPTVMAEGKFLKTNATLAALIEPCGIYEIQDWQIDWGAIGNVIMGAVDPYTGILLQNGECIIGGLKVDRNSYGGFRIKDIDVKVYDIMKSYYNYYNYMEGIDTTFTLDLSELTTHNENSFIYDKEEFNKHGVVNLYFDVQSFIPDFLTGNPFNYTKIDICVSDCENVFNNYASMFNFDAIGLPGQLNTSVTESVKQCLFDPEIQKMMKSAVLYSIYIKSNKY